MKIVRRTEIPRYLWDNYQQEKAVGRREPYSRPGTHSVRQLQTSAEIRLHQRRICTNEEGDAEGNAIDDWRVTSRLQSCLENSVKEGDFYYLSPGCDMIAELVLCVRRRDLELS